MRTIERKEKEERGVGRYFCSCWPGRCGWGQCLKCGEGNLSGGKERSS